MSEMNTVAWLVKCGAKGDVDGFREYAMGSKLQLIGMTPVRLHEVFSALKRNLFV